MLIKFSQLKTDSVKQSNILLQSDFVKRTEDEEVLNSECSISSKSIRFEPRALAVKGFFLFPVLSTMHNKGHEGLRFLFSFHSHYSEWELHTCPWQDLKFRIVTFIANSFSGYFLDINSHSSYLNNPGPSHWKEACLQNNQMNWISLFILLGIIAKCHRILFSGWNVLKCSCILVPLSAIMFKNRILLQCLSSIVPKEKRRRKISGYINTITRKTLHTWTLPASLSPKEEHLMSSS